MEQFDFRRMSFYQIWTRSFCDGNGDGIGDLYGVYDKLEYIKSLGVDGIWFSPIYPSPNADFGYDITDYKNIHPDFGTLDQFKKVLDKAHALGLKVLLDLVINHTSDEHPWFIESCKGTDNPYSDYYIWRNPRFKGETRLPPNNWYSQFEGLAWEFNEQRRQFYLHVFAKKQPDLNMDNPRVREEIKGIMRFWLDMGVDGFREDVINYISKHDQLPNGLPFIPAVNGLPYYKEGPNLKRYLREFRDVVLEYGAIQIGEMPYTSVSHALDYVGGENRVLDMIIQFDTTMADCFMTEYVHHRFMLRKLKRAFSKWQRVLGDQGWNALYLENHDHPRVLSRYGSEQYWRESGSMLAASYIFQRGTPFLYQGQEIGMTNIRLPSIDQYLDVVSKNAYHSLLRFLSEEKRMRVIYVSSRDSARTPVQWTAGQNAGFTSGTPWFTINPNYETVNAETEVADKDSILNFYRACLALRKGNETLLWGAYREHHPWNGRIYMYERYTEQERIIIICSFSAREQKVKLPKGLAAQRAETLLCNYPLRPFDGRMRPYEALVLSFRG
ncbi:MAG: alpha-glucosidase [Clostridia bacterium]|nr:alpha-glucosidase [Clostridia bacterium]